MKPGYVIPCMNLFYLLGYTFVELEDEVRAESCFQSALELNPRDVNSRFELMDILKNEKDLEAIKEILRDTYCYIYKPEDLARLYRYYGWFFIEMEEWDAAIASYFLSIPYADEKGIASAENELGYIEDITGHEIVEPDEEEIELKAEKYHIPLGADSAVLDLILREFERCKEQNDEDLAKYFFELYNSFYSTLD